MLIAIVLGSILSFLMAHLMINFNWSRIILGFFHKNKENWENAFNKMIRFEAMRLGNLIRKNSFFNDKKKDSPEKENKISDIKVNNGSQKIIDEWYYTESKVLRKIKLVFKDEGHLNVSGIPLKLYMREIILKNDFSKINPKKLTNYLLSKLYLKTLREIALTGDDLNEKVKLHEKIDFHQGVILTYTLKLGASEKVSREQMINSPKVLSMRLKTFVPSKFENVDRGIAVSLTTVKQIFCYMRNEARKQQKFEEDFLKKKRESEQRKRAKAPLNPQDVQDALKILEMSRVIDLKSLKKNYKQLAMKHHPDKVTSTNSAKERSAHEKFVLINNAYQTLSKKCA